MKKFALGWKSTELENTTTRPVGRPSLRDREAGGDEACEGGQGTNLGHQCEDDEHRDDRRHHHPPQEQELVAPAQVRNVAEGGAPPELGGCEEEGDAQDQERATARDWL